MEGAGPVKTKACSSALNLDSCIVNQTTVNWSINWTQYVWRNTLEAAMQDCSQDKKGEPDCQGIIGKYTFTILNSTALYHQNQRCQGASKPEALAHPQLQTGSLLILYSWPLHSWSAKHLLLVWVFQNIIHDVLRYCLKQYQTISLTLFITQLQYIESTPQST